MDSRKRWQFPTVLGLILLFVCVLSTGLILFAVCQRNATFYYIKGVSYHMGGRLDYAIANYSEAIEKNPNYAQAYYSRGGACYSMGEMELAAQDYEKYLELVPNAQNRAAVEKTIEEIKSKLTP